MGRKLLLVAASGALVSLSHPLAFGDFDLLARGGNGVLAFVALVPWLIAMRGTNWWRGTLLTFALAAGMYLGTVHWVFIAMFSYGGLNFAVALLGLVAMVAVMAFKMAPAGAIIGRFDLPIVIVAPLAFVGAEWFRNFMFSGFPWSNIAYTQWALPTAQMADLIGLHGLVWLIVFVNAVIAEWIARRHQSAKPWRATVVAAVALVAALVYGFVRPATLGDGDGVPVRVAMVQGNVGQHAKNSASFDTVVIEQYNDMTGQAIEDHQPDLVVWPESALPKAIHLRSTSIGSDLLSDTYDAHLLIGLQTWWNDNDAGEGEVVKRLHNSAYLVSPRRKILQRYDKSHLVPFGEYVPIPFPGFADKLVRAVGDFEPGPVKTIETPFGKVGVVICYEDIFPEISREMAADGARMLINITNDAWYGRSAAPYQHMAMGVFRAIETRLPVLRAANTGVSGVIAPTGELVVQSEIFKAEVVAAEVRTRKASSLYLHVGDTFGWLCLLGMAAFPLVVVIRRRRERARAIHAGDGEPGADEAPEP